VILIAYTLGVFFGSHPFYFTHLETICMHTPCITGQPLSSLSRLVKHSVMK
jgi:hypothetical protein